MAAGRVRRVAILALFLLAPPWLLLAGQPSLAPHEATRIFLERYLRAAPDRTISWAVEENGGPPGFRLVNATIHSSDPAFSGKTDFLVTRDWKWLFDGHVLSLADSATLGRSRPSAEALSSYLSKTAGSRMSVAWKHRGIGPVGMRFADVTQQTPMGPVSSGAALSRDAHWLFFGAFFPLSVDPRIERIKRLGVTGRPSEGPSAAPVTIVECSDFGCPACAALQPALEVMMKRHAGEVRLVHVELPQWAGQRWPFTAAEAGWCLYEVAPKLYPAYRDMVFGMQPSLTDANAQTQLFATVSGLGVPIPLWNECRQKSQARDRLLADLGEARTLGLNGTPIVFVDGVLLDRGIASILEAEMDAALAGQKGAEAPPAPGAKPTARPKPPNG